MNLDILTTTEPTSTYNVIKYCCIGLAMWFVACSTSACGVKLGDNTMIGTPSFAATVYAGELELKKRGVK